MRTVAALLLALACAPHASGQPRPMTVEDMFATRTIGELQVSRDGQTLLFTVIDQDLAANRSITTLMRMTNEAMVAVGEIPQGVSQLRLSPDATRAAFIGTRDGKQGIWIYELATGRVTRVCDYDRGNSFLSKAGSALAWSPDGTQLAFAGTLEPTPPPADPVVITRLQYKTRTSLTDNRRSHLFVVAAAGGVPRQLTSGDFDEHSIDWGGKGQEIVFLSNHAADPDVLLNYDIFAADVASGAVRRITNTPGVEMNPRVSPTGRLIAYVATTRAVTTIDSVAEDAHLFVVPVSGGTPSEINHAQDRRSADPAWTADERFVVYTAGDHGRTSIYKVPWEGGATRQVTAMDAQRVRSR